MLADEGAFFSRTSPSDLIRHRAGTDEIACGATVESLESRASLSPLSPLSLAPGTSDPDGDQSCSEG